MQYDKQGITHTIICAFMLDKIVCAIIFEIYSPMYTVIDAV